MGEYAEMMLDGTCCACCGEYLGADTGFAVHCAGCAPDFGNEPFTGLPLEPKRQRKLRGDPGTPKACVCGTCGKAFMSKGARHQHRKAAHRELGAGEGRA